MKSRKIGLCRVTAFVLAALLIGNAMSLPAFAQDGSVNEPAQVQAVTAQPTEAASVPASVSGSAEAGIMLSDVGSQPAQGDGSASNPYQIGTADELWWFAAEVNNGNYGLCAVLTADINVNSDSSNPWTPIGDRDHYSDNTQPTYTGTFDGQGHTVSGLYFSKTNANNDSTSFIVGLFGYSEGTISNVGVVDSYLWGGMYIGGVCGENHGTISNCYNSGTVGATYTSVGGICGCNEGTITNCYNTGAVSSSCNQFASSYIGGVCGENYATITNCYNIGTVSGSNHDYPPYIGGVSGYNSSSRGKITNCYFLSETASEGIGYGSGEAASKAADQFASGEVANLLQGDQSGTVWGQTIGTGGDAYPVLTSDQSKQVFKVTFDYTTAEDVVKYANSGGTVTLPSGSGWNPSTGYTTRWLGSDGTEITTTSITVTANTTLTEKSDFFAPGAGTEDSPYLIPDLETLKAFRDYVNKGNTCSGKYFKVTADIDLKNESWTPIGTDANRFSGTFDGGGHTISGLYINSTSSNQGLFGYVSGAVIQNITVSGAVTSTKDNVGGIAGQSANSAITNCANNAAVSGRYSVGGIVGNSASTTITGCANTGAITGTSDNVGGIAGYSPSSTIEACANSGTVSGSQHVGGIAGWNAGTIENCSNTAAGTGTNYVGGIVGNNYGSVTNCYNTGTNYVGGIVGTNWGTGSVTNCYYLSTAASTGIGQDRGTASTTSKTAEEFASGEVAKLLQGTQSSLVWGQTVGTDTYPVLTDDQSKQVCKVTFDYTTAADVVQYVNYGDTVTLPAGSGFDASTGNLTQWVTEDGKTFTDSITVTANITLTQTDVFFAQGAGTTADPYLIPDLATLEAFRDYVNGGNDCAGLYFKVTADIDLDGSEDNQWTPIGNVVNSSSLFFAGTFDGGGHTISGLYIDSTQDYQGLFGYIIGGTVENLSVSGSVTGDWYVGGIAGKNSGTIANCSNTGTVTGSDYVGGIAGLNTGTIENCSNTGAVSGDYYVGGIAGWNTGTITNCYSIGAVSGDYYVGGIAGYNYYGTVSNCYYLSGTANSGIGYNDSTGEAEAIEKTEEAFASGEVANLLQGTQSGLIWGQTIGTDDSPVLTDDQSKQVCKVTFQLEDGSEYAAAYVNYGGTATLPADPGMTEDGMVFKYWASENGEEFTAGTQVTGDITVEAVYGEQDIISVTITWGELAYTYDQGEWNADTHTYDGAGWRVDTTGGDTVTVENTGTVDVTASVAYTQEDENVRGTFDRDSAELPADGEPAVFILTLAGEPKQPMANPLGTVTVTIGGGDNGE